MIIDLTDTTSGKIASTLVSARHRSGTPTTGAVLTLVVSTEERHHYDAMKAASKAAREHPARIIIVIGRPDTTRTRLDAEVRVGDENGPGEVIVLRLYGELAAHADSVVVPLLLPDVPVVAWWPDEGPDTLPRRALQRLSVRARSEAVRLRKAIDELDTEVKIVVTHFAPTVSTLGTEPIFKHFLLGNMELARAIDSCGVDLVIHGHAHHGNPIGRTMGGTPVRNVAYDIAERFIIHEIAPDVRLAYERGA